MWEQLKRITKPNAAIVLFGSQPFTSALIMSNIKMFKYCWVWDKGQGTGFLNAEKQPLKSCEDVCVFYEKQSIYNPQMRKGFLPYIITQGKTKSKNYRKQTGATTISNGDRYPINKIVFQRDNTKIHPTQKPVALIQYLIMTYTNKGDLVLDFTIGSGTTAVAAHKTDRHFIGFDNDADIFKTAERRIELETAQTKLDF